MFFYGLAKYNMGLEETFVMILCISSNFFFQSAYAAENGNDSYRKQGINTKFCVSETDIQNTRYLKE